MRTHARQAIADPNRSWPCPSLPIWLGLFASLLLMVGGVWDIAWHQTLRRDTVWSPPHLLIYSGVALTGGVCLAVVIGATVGRRLGPWEEHTLVECWGLRAPRGFVLAGGGVLAAVLSAPFDAGWHWLFGRDTFWSPPHLLAIGAVGVIRLGLIAALVGEICLAGHTGQRGPLPWSWRGTTLAEGVLGVLFSLVLGLALFALGAYASQAATRAPVVYPMLASLAVPVVLVAGVRTLGRLGAATLIVLLLLVWQELLRAVLWATAFMPPGPLPLWPLYLIPAAVMDGLLGLVRRRLEAVWTSMAAGLLFGGSCAGTTYGYTWYLTGVCGSIGSLALSVGLAGGLGALSAWAGHQLWRWIVAPDLATTD